MTSSPLHMEAFKSTGAKRVIMEKDGTVVEVEHQLPSLIFAYKLALIMYNQALYYKVHDELEWRYDILCIFYYFFILLLTLLFLDLTT